MLMTVVHVQGSAELHTWLVLLMPNNNADCCVRRHVCVELHARLVRWHFDAQADKLPTPFDSLCKSS